MSYRISAALVCALALAACGGGSSESNVNVVGSEPPNITPNSILIGDMLVGGPGFPDERISSVECAADLSYCTGTWRGQAFTIDDIDLEAGPDPEEDPEEVTAYTSLGTWKHMLVATVHERSVDTWFKIAVVGGIRHPNSQPLSGSATWTGDMVGLDDNDRLIRGGARLTIDDFRVPAVDVVLTPNERARMVWNDLRVTRDGFSQRRATTDHIKGEFYGPGAEEVGGVFERNRIVGAFGAAKR